MNEELYQKTGLIVSRLALELLKLQVGDRVPSISYFEDKYGVARGTVQNAFIFLKQQGAIQIQSKGKLGSYLTEINYRILQQYSYQDRLMGVMPLPYSKLYEGLATALYDSLKAESIHFNLAYVRGAQQRIQMVVSGAYDFAVCSLFAAQKAIEQKMPVQTLLHFGDYTYLSKHVLVVRDKAFTGIEDGMRIGIDNNSFDQYELTMRLIASKKNIRLVEMHSHQIVSNIKQGTIDAGVWNYDEILERGDKKLNVVEINEEASLGYTQAAIVIRNDNENVRVILESRIDIDQIRKIQDQVCDGSLIPSY